MTYYSTCATGVFSCTFPTFSSQSVSLLETRTKKIKEVFSLLSWCGFLAGIKLEIFHRYRSLLVEIRTAFLNPDTV